MRRSTTLLDRVVIVVDWALLFCASLWTLPSGPHLFATPAAGLEAGALLSLACVYILYKSNLYQIRRYRKPYRPTLDVFVALLVTIAGAGLSASLVVSVTSAGWIWLLKWFAAGLFLLAAGRQILRLITEQGMRSGALLRKTAVIGATPMGGTILRRLVNLAQTYPCRLVGIFDDRGPDRRPAALDAHPVIGTVSTLCRYAETHPVDLIIIALPWNRAKQIWTIFQEVQSLGADVYIALDPAFDPGFLRTTTMAGIPMLHVMQQPLQGPRGLLKLAEDYVIAAIAVVVFAPVMVLIALAVRLDSPGPALFRQQREGLNRKLFGCYKFRTMLVNAEDRGVVGVIPGDPRITRVGRFLRMTSLDELPQLFNVLRGEMSIVGPRPHVPEMRVGDLSYGTAIWEYAVRHRIKPGITGWAQVNGARGRVSDIKKAGTVVQLDMEYIENWSIWLDFRIIVRTVLSGFIDKTAA